MYLGYLISWLHPILVHFPIVLLLGAFGVELVGFFRKDPFLAKVAKGLLVSGCVISLFAFVSGNFAEVFAVRGGTPHDPVDLHALWAMWTTWMFIILTVVRFYVEPRKGSLPFKGYLAGLLLASVFLGYTAHQGGALVFEHGANVKAVHDAHAVDMKDLRDLYQEQTVESIVYSEMMHHIFGWLVLALSFFLIISKLWPEKSKKWWRGGPYVLFAGGVFLMIFSDTDSWPLSHARPIYDKEVLQHKIFATLMLAAGAVSFMRRKRSTSGVPGEGYHLGLALLALVGGGLLFTHVHSVAPYSNRAIGVYLHHLTMGFIALCAGSASLWEAFRPKGPKWRGYLWPSILIVESILLICYNENIPWFARPFTNMEVGAMHGSRFDLRVTTQPDQPQPGRPCQLDFEIFDKTLQKRVSDLEIQHEHPLHLIIVSRDLSFFDHVHPEPRPDGTLSLSYTFPHGGDFLLFADCIPKGQAGQSFRVPVTAEGPAPQVVPLIESVYETMHAGSRDILFFNQPMILAPGQPSRLRFVLFSQEKGLSDLEPFLGCFGHCVIVSEDGSYYLHTHPDDHQHGGASGKSASSYDEPVPNATDGLPQLGDLRRMMFNMGMTSPSMSYGGPEVSFPALFPKSGLYKVWGQFRQGGEVITVPFVVRVP